MRSRAPARSRPRRQRSARRCGSGALKVTASNAVARPRTQRGRVGIESLTKDEVRAIADRLRPGDPHAIDEAVRFVCAESVNQWHGRGRAMMCRRLKHIPMSRSQSGPLVIAILARLASGHFSEQFRDQLRLALHLDRKGTLEIARRGARSEKAHVRRYSEWLLSHEEAA
jgi:hypothetical protein